MKKRILSVLITIILLVCSTSCGSEEKSLLQENISDAVYRFREVKISFEGAELPAFPEEGEGFSGEGGFSEEAETPGEGASEEEGIAQEEGEPQEGEASLKGEEISPKEGNTLEEEPQEDGTSPKEGDTQEEGEPQEGETSPKEGDTQEEGAPQEEDASLKEGETQEEGTSQEEGASSEEDASMVEGYYDESMGMWVEEGEDDGRADFELLFSAGERLSAIVSKYTAAGPALYLFSCDGSGEDQKLVLIDTNGEIPAEQDALAGLDAAPSYDHYCIGEDGGFYALGALNTVDEMTGQETEDYYLTAFSSEGKRTATWKLPIEKASDGHYWLQDMRYLGNGRLAFVDSKYVFAFDTASKRRWNLYESKDYMDASISVMRDGSVLMGNFGDKGYELHELDADTGKFGDLIKVEGSFYGSMITGITHDAYFFGSRAIWYYDKKGSVSGKIVDLTASDMLVDEVSGIAEMAGDKIALLTSTYSDGGRSPSLFIGTHIPADEVRDKKEITISCVYADSNIMRKVVEFNRQNDEYRIRVADYSQFQSDDWSYPYTKLNTDIVSGNIPDIIIIDDMLPVESYISKGILTDLTDLLAADEEIAKEEYLQNVFDTFRVGDALYQIIPAFMVYTGVMRTDVLHGRTTLPMREFLEVCQEQGVQMRNAFGGMTRSQLMSTLLYIQGTEYVDLATGKCAFDSQAFIDLLDLLAQFPEQDDNTNYQEWQKAYRDGSALLMLYGISDFSSYGTLRYGQFGTDITMIGIPGGSTSGSVIMPQLQLAMTTSTKYPEVVWGFIRSFLLEEYQDKLDWGLPVRVESLKKKAEKAKQRPYYINEEGKKEEYDNTWWIAGQEVVIPPLTDEEVTKVFDFLRSCDRRAFNNSTVTNIINEETAAFFQGQKTAEEVTKIIQSRAQIYVHENR